MGALSDNTVVCRNENSQMEIIKRICTSHLRSHAVDSVGNIHPTWMALKINTDINTYIALAIHSSVRNRGLTHRRHFAELVHSSWEHIYFHNCTTRLFIGLVLSIQISIGRAMLQFIWFDLTINIFVFASIEHSKFRNKRQIELSFELMRLWFKCCTCAWAIKHFSQGISETIILSLSFYYSSFLIPLIIFFVSIFFTLSFYSFVGPPGWSYFLYPFVFLFCVFSFVFLFAAIGHHGRWGASFHSAHSFFSFSVNGFLNVQVRMYVLNVYLWLQTLHILQLRRNCKCYLCFIHSIIAFVKYFLMIEHIY